MIGIASALFSPIGRIGMIGVALLSLYTFGYWKGHSSASRASEIAALQSQLSALRKDKATADEAAKLANDQAAQNAEIARANARIVEGFRNAPSSACGLTGDDVRRLRSIR